MKRFSLILLVALLTSAALCQDTELDIFARSMFQLCDKCWVFADINTFEPLGPDDWVKKVDPTQSSNSTYDDGVVSVQMVSGGNDPTGIALIGYLKSNPAVIHRMDMNIGWQSLGWPGRTVIYEGTVNNAPVILYTNGLGGLVAYYPFSGNAIDWTGNGRDGAVYGATLTADRFGRPNCAYAFNGVNNYIKASGVGLPNRTRTVSLWFMANSVGNRPGLLGYGGSGDCGTSWHEGINLWGAGSYAVTSHCNVKELVSSYGADPPIAKWHHWVVSSDPTGTKMFLDGVLIASSAVYFDNTYTNQGDLGIGTLAGC